MTRLTQLDAVTLHVLASYVEGESKLLSSTEIVDISLRINEGAETVENYLHILAKHLYTNKVNTMVFLSDLEWSYFVIEGLWGILETLNTQNNYNFTSSETLMLTTKNLAVSAENIGMLPFKGAVSLEKSSPNLEVFLDRVLCCENLLKLNEINH